MKNPKKYDNNIFAKNLSYYMNKNNENQSEIAKLLGVSKTTITLYIQGENIPRMDKIKILCDHFGISVTELLEEPRAEKAPEEETIHTIAAHAIRDLTDEDVEEIMKFAKYLKSKYKDK